VANPPKPRIDTSIAATSGALLGLFLMFNVALSGGHFLNSAFLTIVSIVSVTLLASAWKFGGVRLLAVILGFAMATPACLLLAADVLTHLFNPDPLAARAARAEKFLAECPPSEIRFVYYDPQNYSLSMRAIDLNAGTWSEQAKERHGTEGTFSSDNFGASPYTPTQIATMQEVIASFPSPRTAWKHFIFGYSPIDGFGFALYRDGWRRTGFFERDEVEPQRKQLATILHIPFDDH
jgi:hypothetical protein